MAGSPLKRARRELQMPKPEPNGVYEKFKPGNEHRFKPGDPRRTSLPVKHGAFVAEYVQPAAALVRAEMLAQPHLAYLGEVQYAEAFTDWCDTIAQIRLIRAWRDGMSPEDQVTDVRQIDSEEIRAAPGRTVSAVTERHTDSAIRTLSKLQAHALALGKELGLTPAAAARMGKDAASARVSLAQLWASDDEDDEPGAG